MLVRSPFRNACVLAIALSLAAAAQAQITIVFNPAFSPDWAASSNWSLGILPSSIHRAQIAGVGVSVSGSQSVGAISLTTNGTIGGSGTLTLTSTTFDSSWTGGILSGSGTLAISSDHTLALTGGDNKAYTHLSQSFGGHIIRNQGTVTWADGGNLLGGDGATFINEAGAVFTATNNQALGWTTGGDRPLFSNAGLFEKTGGLGATVISEQTFVNTGTVHAQVGTIRFASGAVTGNGGTFTADDDAVIEFANSQTFTAGTSFTGDGVNRIAGGTVTFSGSILSDNLVFAGGSLSGGATFTGDGATWTGGQWVLGGTFHFATGTLTISGLGQKTLTHGSQSFAGRVVRIGGTARWLDGGEIVGGDGAGFVVDTGGTFEIHNDSIYRHSNGGDIPYFVNNGTLIKKIASGITTFDRVAFTNTGTLDLDLGQLKFIGGATTFSNSGTVNLAPGTVLRLEAGGGTSTGVFNLGAGSRVELAGGIQTFGTGASVMGGGSFDIVDGTLLVNGPAIVGNLGFGPGHMRLVSGTLGGPGTLTLKPPARFTWEGGTMAGSGTLLIESGASLDIAGPNSKTMTFLGQSFNGHKISNFGLVQWLGTGTVFGSDGARITNEVGGTFSVQTGGLFTHGGGGDAPAFVNHGNFEKIFSTDTFTISNAGFINSTSGLVDVQQGTFDIAGGGSSAGTFSVGFNGSLLFSNPYTIAGGAILGTGMAIIGDVVTFTSDSTVGNGFLNGSLKIVAGGALTGPAKVTIYNGSVLEWNGGDMQGSGTTEIISTGMLHITGNTPMIFTHGGQSFNGRKIDNYGTILWEGSSPVFGNDGAALTNRPGATIDVQVATTLGTSGGSPMTFTNEGTLKKSDGGGAFTYSGGAFDHTGVVLAQNGAIRFAAGGTSTGGEFQALSGTLIEFSAPYTFQDGTFITGGGQVFLAATTLTVAGGAPSRVDGTLVLPINSSIAGGGTLDVYGDLLWTGGSMRDAGITRVQTGGELILSGADPKVLTHAAQSFNGRRLHNAGLISLSGLGNFMVNDGAAIENQAGGTFALESGADIAHSGGNQGTIANAGLFIKRNNSATATLTGPTFTNRIGGVVTSESGILEFNTPFVNEGGMLSAQGGASIVLSGPKTIDGGLFMGGGDIDIVGSTTALSGTLTSQNLNFAGGTISGIASLAGLIEWSGGSVTGSSVLTIPDSTTLLQIAGDADKTLAHFGQTFNGPILDNSGSVLWTGGGDILLGDGAQIVNRLNFTAQNDALLGFSHNGNAPLFDNRGTFSKIDGSGTTLVNLPFANSGAVLATSGRLQFSSTFTHTAGSLSLANGAIVRFDQGLNFPSGAIVGDGTIEASISNGGTISPGLPLGVLIVDGNLSLLATSALLVELGGTSQGLSYDLLDVDGSVTLGGTLHVSFANGFEALVTPANTFTVAIGTGPLAGAFSNVANGQRLDLMGLGSFQVHYGAGSIFDSNTLVLSNFAPIPEPSTWAMLIAGAAAVLLLTRRRRA